MYVSFSLNGSLVFTLAVRTLSAQLDQVRARVRTRVATGHRIQARSGALHLPADHTIVCQQR